MGFWLVLMALMISAWAEVIRNQTVVTTYTIIGESENITSYNETCGEDTQVNFATCFTVPYVYNFTVFNNLPNGYELVNITATIVGGVYSNLEDTNVTITFDQVTFTQIPNLYPNLSCQTEVNVSNPFSIYLGDWHYVDGEPNSLFFEVTDNRLTETFDPIERERADGIMYHETPIQFCFSSLVLSFVGVDVDPKVTLVKPRFIPARFPGTQLTIIGNNFRVGETYYCSFYTQTTHLLEATMVIVQNPTSVVTCHIPDEITENADSVSFSFIPNLKYGIFSTSVWNLTVYNNPLLQAVYPPNSTAAGKVLAVIKGDGFFKTNFIQASFGSFRVSATYRNSTAIEVYVPPYSKITGGYAVSSSSVLVSVYVSEDGIYFKPSDLKFLYLDVPSSLMPPLYPTTAPSSPPPPEPAPSPLSPEPEPVDPPFDFSKYKYLIYVGGGLVGLLIIVALIVCLVRRRTKKDEKMTDYHVLPDLNLQCVIDPKEIILKERVGRGRFSDVYRGVWRKTEVAVKKLDESVNSPEVVKELFREVNLIMNLRHPNVLTFLGAAVKAPNHLAIVLEFLPRGSLYDVLQNKNIIVEPDHIRKMSLDCARGMTYLHGSRIIHRDLKTTNLLVDENWVIKVADFGLSRLIDSKPQTLSSCGTPAYSAPEVLKFQKYSFKADVYSFGIVLYEMCTRQEPFKNMQPYNIVLNVATKGLRPDLGYLSDNPAELTNLMK
eukprot:TRINITY_DN5674_c0_g1_i2.p1 TRINITY_DN5674_c0_g1~~TRINITY_DN5674_c0_g1_i2.p1  ORF type:complete len:718 (-),score=112.45 TRINITY_DN5674_c0_g1_i2:221-2374(-)